MQRIPTDRHRSASPEDLLSFLRVVQEDLETATDFRLVSILLQVEHLDPLAVLQTIFVPQEWHGYLEHPAEDVAWAGADALHLETFSGAARFHAAEEAAAALWQKVVLVGDVEAAEAAGASVPALFVMATFLPEPAADAEQPALALWLPRWQVFRRGALSLAVANLRVDQGTDLQASAERIFRAYGQFRTFRYRAQAPGLEPQVTALSEVAAAPPYSERVAAALRRIEAGQFKKIVLTRALEVRFDAPLEPLELCHRLRERYPACRIFSFSSGSAASWIGATPERLIARQGEAVLSEALAGTAARGVMARDDAERAAALLASDKDRREHEAVVTSLVRRLEEAGAVEVQAGTPGILRLPHVQHLRTPLRGRSSAGLLELAGHLHPSPAVGGSPRAAALEALAGLEAYDRQLYTGLVGVLLPEGEGDLLVALRCARVEGDRARLFAGAGIVSGSEPEAELRETDLKFRALLELLGAQASDTAEVAAP